MRAWALSLVLLSCRASTPGDTPSCPAATIECVPYGVAHCSPGFESDGDGGCAPVLPECAQDEISTPGECHPVGVTACAEGFVREDGGCRAVVAKECDGSTMARLGSATCVPIATCAAGPYAATSAPAIHVDAAYAGADSDGSAAKPYARLGDALATVTATRKTLLLTDGDYEFTGTLTQPIDLVGRCPEKVTVHAPKGSLDTFRIESEVSLRGLTIGNGGLRVNKGSLSLAGTRVYKAYGSAIIALKGTAVTLVDSVVDRPGDRAISIEGATLSLTRSEVRFAAREAILADPVIGVASSVHLAASIVSDSAEDAITAPGGRVTVEGSLVRRTGARTRAESKGIYVDARFGFAPQLLVRRTNVEHTAGMAIGAFDGTASIEDVTVRATAPSTTGPGFGLMAGVDPRTKKPARVTIDRSLFVATEGNAIVLGDANAALTRSIVRDTRRSSHADTGRAVIAFPPASGAFGAAVDATECLFETSVGMAVSVSSGKLTLDRTVIRDIAPEPYSDLATKTKSRFGFGIDVFAPDGAAQPRVLVRRSLVERVHDAGMVAFGARLDVEDCVIRSVAPRDNGIFGHGVHFTFSRDYPATGTIRGSFIADVAEVGVQAFQTDIEIEGTTIRDVRPNGDGFFADGVGVVSVIPRVPYRAASLALRGVKVAGVARAAVAVFNAHASIEGLLSRCNGLGVSVESVSDEYPNSLEDRSGNACGCETLEPCKAASGNLSPLNSQL